MSYLDELMATGEEMRLVTRGHWFNILRPVAAYLLLLVALVLISGIAFGADAGQWGGILGGSSLLLATIAVLLLAVTAVRWRARQYVVTTRRVLQLDGVFNKRVSDTNLDKVNDVVLNHSWLGRLLGYGDIEIITASESGIDVFQRISDPVGFKRTMLDNKEDFDTLARVSAPPAPDIPAQIEHLASLRDQGVIGEDEFTRKKDELLARM